MKAIHGETLPATEVCPEYPHEKRTAEQIRAHLDRGRRLCGIIRHRGHVLLPETLERIADALRRDEQLRELRNERRLSLKEARGE